ncbi:MAG: cobalt transporter CbiM [Deltaproteobacteria bacterium]|nr:cobalt transporter CbiM [Deltaproteobacteria bacterium]
MHIPDGYLGPATYGGLWAVMVPIWVYASRKVKKSLEIGQIPLLAMASVFSLVAMVFAIPLPGGTTGHLNGVSLVAILLGPWAATIAVSVALAIQALVFGEGGITALGANCFNIAFVGAFTGYGFYRLIAGLGFPPKAIGAGIASYLSLNLSGLLTAVELGLQSTIHPATLSYFPFPLMIAVPAIMIPHLTVLGLIEATITVLILLIMLRTRPAFPGLSKKLAFLFAGLLFLAPSAVLAHDFWIEKKGNEFMLVFGHGTQRLEFESSKVRKAKAFSQQGKELKVNMEKRGNGMLLKAEEFPSLFFVEIDDGYWSKTIYGWKNLPKTKASRVVESFRSFYYSKAILSWGEAVQNPVSDARLDIVPLENPFLLKEGETLPVRVHYQGKPVSGLEIESGDHQKMMATDREGIARLKISKGQQVFSVTHKEPIKNDLDADSLRIVSSLMFEVTK